MSEYNIQMNKYNALNAEYDQLYPQPMKHASTHAKDGDDPITPSSIGAAELGADGKVLTSQLPSIEVDAYTKVQTLSDTTKTLFGLDANAVPDDALAQINNLIVALNSSVSNLALNVNNKAKISTGSYVGNRNSGSSYPNSLTFNFKPHFLVIAVSAEAGYNAQAMFFLDMLGSAYMQLSYWYCAGDSKLSSLNTYAKLVNNTVYWYSSGGLEAQMNNDYTYNYFAIG